MAIEPTNVVGVTEQWNASQQGDMISAGAADEGSIAISGQECPTCGTRSAVDDILCLHCGEQLAGNQEMKGTADATDGLQDLSLENGRKPADDESSLQDTMSPSASEDVVAATRSARSQPSSHGSFTESLLRTQSQRSRDEPFAGLDRLWLPNEATEICLGCSTQFGVNKRKHHCRVCGLIFCSACVAKKIKLPESFGYGSAQQRSCETCVRKLQDGIIRSPADVFALRRGGVKRQNTSNLNPSQSFVHQVMEQIAYASSSDFVDHYAVLGVKQDASMAEINSQFRSLVQVVQEAERLASEGNSNVPPPPASFRDLNRSFNVLRDPEARMRFDAELEQIRIQAMKKLREDAGDVVKTKPMSKDCQVCFRPFNTFRRRHHCRRCGSSVCDPCSPEKRTIPEFGVNKPQRVCKTCISAPPKLKKMIIHITALPLQGYEYLQTLELKSTVFLTNTPDVFTLTTGFEAASQKFTVTEKEAEILKTYNIEVKRQLRDFEWVHRKLSKTLPMNSLPPLPGKLSIRNLNQYSDTRVNKRNESELQDKLNSYVRAIMWHPLLADLDPVKAFLGFSNSDWRTYMEQDGNYGRDYLANFNTLEKWLRFRLEYEQVRTRIQLAQRRVTAVNVRLTANGTRESRQARRAKEQVEREEAVTNGASVVEAIKAKQAARIVRETERFQRQDNASQILFIDREADDKERQQEQIDVQEKKEEYVHRRNNWLTEMEEWQADMSSWTLACSQRTAQATPRAGLAVNDWLLKHSSMPWADIVNDCSQPQALQLMRQTMESLEAEEPEKLVNEQQLSAAEWTRLVEEENRLKAQRVHLDTEERLWTEWDVAAEREAAFIAAEQARRKEKENQIETDVARMEREIEARRENQKKRWDLIDLREKKLLEGEQELHKRLESYQSRENNQNRLNDEISKRIALERSRLESQQKEQRILRFIRDAEDEGRIRTEELLKKHRYELAMNQSDFDRYRNTLPEGLDATEVDLMIEATEMQEVERGNPRTEWEDPADRYDERDNFMNNLKRRRKDLDAKLEAEKNELMASSNRCRQLMARIQFMAQQFDTESSRVAQENETLNRLADMLQTEISLVQEEQDLRAFKIQTLQQKLDEAATTVEQLTTYLMERTKAGIDRAARQGSTIDKLKKMQIDTAKRIDNRQTGIMHTDKRQTELKERLEVLQSENWQKGITLNSGKEFQTHSAKFQSGFQEYRQADADSKVLAELGPKDLEIVALAIENQQNDRRVLNGLMPTLNSIEGIFGTEMSAVLENEDIPLTDRFRQKIAQIRTLVEKLKTGLETEEANTNTESLRLESEKVALSDLCLNLQRERDLIALEEQNLTNESLLLDQEQNLLAGRCDEAAKLYVDLRNYHDQVMLECNKLTDDHRKRGPPPTRSAIIASIRDNVLVTERRSEMDDVRMSKPQNTEKSLLSQLTKAQSLLAKDEQELRALVERGQSVHQGLLSCREKMVQFVFEDDVYSKVMAFVHGMAPTGTLLASMPWLEKLQSLRSDVVQRQRQHLKHLDQEIRVVIGENLRVGEALQEVQHHMKELHQLQDTVKRDAELWEVHRSELTTNTGRAARPAIQQADSDNISMDIDAIRARRVLAQSNSNTGNNSGSSGNFGGPEVELQRRPTDRQQLPETRAGSFEL